MNPLYVPLVLSGITGVVVLLVMFGSWVANVVGRHRQRMANRFITQAHSDYDVLVKRIKRAKTDIELEFLTYEIDQFFEIYSMYVDINTIGKMAERLDTHVLIRRCMVK